MYDYILYVKLGDFIYIYVSDLTNHNRGV